MAHKSSRTQTRSTRGIDTNEHDVERDPETFEAQTTSEATGDGVAIRGTIDPTSIRTIIEHGWFNAAVCRGGFTAETENDIEYRRGPVGKRAILGEMADCEPKTCWVDQNTDGRQIVTLYWTHTSYEISLDLRNAVYSFDKQAPSEEADVMTIPSQSAEMDLCDPDQPTTAGTSDVADSGGPEEWIFGDTVDTSTNTTDLPEADPEAKPTPESPGAVFEQLSTGDKVLWDAVSDADAPLTVAVGREDAQKLNGGDGPDIPTVYLEDQEGKTKTLHRSPTQPSMVSVSTPGEESDGIELVNNLRIVGHATHEWVESDAGDRE